MSEQEAVLIHCGSRLVCGLLILLVAIAPAYGDETKEIVRDVLKTVPLIDGHNDLPWQCRARF